MESLQLAEKFLGENSSYQLLKMDAAGLKFKKNSFDLVLCIQNGISVFKVNKEKLIKETLKETRRGGIIVFSSYSHKFWEERLKWFRLQAQHHLLGKIDEKITKDGIIYCKDGFKATTVSTEEFKILCSNIGIEPKMHEIKNSSIFCEIKVP